VYSVPIENNREYYWMLEVCRNARISRSTLLRWLKQGIIKEPLRDRRGYRIFTGEDLRKIKAEAGKKYRFQRTTLAEGKREITYPPKKI
jgi:DNA-binding transcriptional MerR regulator